MFRFKAIYLPIIMSLIAVLCISTLYVGELGAQSTGINKVQALRDTLPLLEQQANHEIVGLNFASLAQVINSKASLSKSDTSLLIQYYDIVTDPDNPYRLSDISSYTGRHRSFIISWISPTDGEISFAAVRLPETWDIANEYPLYIYLHGLWDIAWDKIHYALLPALLEGATDPPPAFLDGYTVEPWGRGNLWYRGIAETDVWECIARINELFSINAHRRYIAGFSMGGSGAWYIGSRSAEYWAAVGIQSGVVVYEGGMEEECITGLSDVPVYLISGDRDDLTQWMEAAYHLLKAAGNPHVGFDTFEGGHEFLEPVTDSLYRWLQKFERTSSVEEPGEAINPAQAFPNPTSGILYVGGYGEILDGRYWIYDSLGQLIKQDHCRGRIIDLTDLLFKSTLEATPQG